MIPAVQDAFLYACIAAVLSLGAKEFGMINLAAGVWVVAGGWLAGSVAGFMTGTQVPVTPLHFITMALFAGVQIASPFWLGGAVRSNPLMYLFVSLGIAVATSSLASAYLLDAHSANIPFEAMAGGLPALVVGALAIIVTVLIFRTQSWNRLAMRTRLPPGTDWPAGRLSVLLSIEIGLLISIGASAYHVHKGLFVAAEHYTVVPLLALIAARFNPIYGAVAGFGVTIVSHLMHRFVPALTPFSTAIAILILVSWVVITSIPISPLVMARSHVRRLPPKIVSNVVASLLGQPSVALISVSVAGLLLGMASQAFHAAALLAALAVAAWLSQRYLGVMSIAWPVFGVWSAYTIASLSQLPSVTVLLIVMAIVLIGAGYITSLRLLSAHTAMVVDLAFVVLLFDVATNSAAVSGTDNVRYFTADGGASSNRVVAGSAQASIVIGSIVTAIYIEQLGRVRAWLLALANVRVGFRNGIRVGRAMFSFSAILVTATVVSTLTYHVAFRPIRPDEMSVVSGMTILLLGNLAGAVGVGVMLILVFSLFGVIASLWAGAGPILNVATGIAFVVMAFAAQNLVGDNA